MPPIVWAICIIELGRFDRAADCWLAILREHPDTDLSPGSLSVKAALALFRAGRRAEFEQIKAELADRYSDEKVTLGGQTASPRELLARLMSDEKWVADPANPSSSPSAARGPASGGNGRSRLANAVRRIGRSRHDAARAHSVGIQFLERRRAGRDGRRNVALRQLSRSCFRDRFAERQDALAVGVVS